MILNSTDMFLGYNWLVKNNPEVNLNIETIQFTKCPKSCKTPYQDVLFRNRKLQLIDNQEKQQEIGRNLKNYQKDKNGIMKFT